MDLSRLEDPICDLRYLLNRGYPRETSLEWVSVRYRLGKGERNFLHRAVFSRREGEDHRRRLVGMEAVEGEEVLLDGYNVLITLEEVLEGRGFLCDDGIVRDARGAFGKYRPSERTGGAIDAAVSLLQGARPRRVLFLFDAQVSRSGELCRRLRRAMAVGDLLGDARTSKRVDSYLLRNRKKVLCTSDRVLVEKAERILDLPFHLAQRLGTLTELPSCSGVLRDILGGP
jgi:hypothetical protein